MSDGNGNGVFSVKYDPRAAQETYYNDNVDDNFPGELNNNKMAALMNKPLTERRERRIVKTHDSPDAKILDVTEQVQSLSVSALPLIDITDGVKTVAGNPTSAAGSVTGTISSVTDGKADAVTDRVSSLTDDTPVAGVTDKVSSLASDATSPVEAITEAVSPLGTYPVDEAELHRVTTARPRTRKEKGKASILNNNKISVLPIDVKSKVEHKKQSITNIFRSKPAGSIRNDLTDFPTNVKDDVTSIPSSIQNDITSIPATGSNVAYENDGKGDAPVGGIVNRVASLGDIQEVSTPEPLKKTTPQKKPRAMILNNNKVSVLPINVKNDVSKRTQSITNIVGDVPPSIQNDLADIPTTVKDAVAEMPKTVKDAITEMPTTEGNVATESPSTEEITTTESPTTVENVATENLSTAEDVPSKITSYAKTFAKNSKYVIVKLGPETFGSDNKYEYAVVTTPSRLTLGILARDLQVFNEKYATEVFDFLKANNFVSIWNRPRPVLHEKNCQYPSIE